MLRVIEVGFEHAHGRFEPLHFGRVVSAHRDQQIR